MRGTVKRDLLVKKGSFVLNLPSLMLAHKPRNSSSQDFFLDFGLPFPFCNLEYLH